MAIRWVICGIKAFLRGVIPNENTCFFLEEPSAQKMLEGVLKYQKVAGSRAIGGYLNLENNSSRSFIVLLSGIQKVLGY